jgi:hypothetical protein
MKASRFVSFIDDLAEIEWWSNLRFFRSIRSYSLTI